MAEVCWYERETQLIQLGYIDNSEPYEVDQAMIGLDKVTGKFVLLTASGCSCWGGEACEESFDDLDALASSLHLEDREFSPSLKGAEVLVREARETFRAYSLKAFDR